MRAYVLAVAVTALAQPALAREHHRHSSQHVSHHHRLASGHHHHSTVRHRYPERFDRDEAVRMPAVITRREDAMAPAWAESSEWSAWRPQPYEQPYAQPLAQPSRPAFARASNGALDAMIARHAAANGLPESLVRRVVMRESGGNPRASSRGNFGLMQIRHATARSMGYTGSAAGLLDAETNMTYAVRYLAGAYRAAGGNASRAVAYYASGYHGRGVTVARRAPVRLAQNTSWQSDAWQSSNTPWQMQATPVAMTGEYVPVRRVHRYRRY